VHARNLAEARRVAALGAGSVGTWPPEPGSWDLLVNCTPVGMYPQVDATPIPAAQLTGRYVYDLIYNPAVTRLIQDAKRAGCETFGGLEMLVAQAEEQFQWWTTTRPPSGTMRDAASKRLAEFVRDADYVV
jgi:shikimate 5-dehydrogenase